MLCHSGLYILPLCIGDSGFSLEKADSPARGGSGLGCRFLRHINSEPVTFNFSGSPDDATAQKYKNVEELSELDELVLSTTTAQIAKQTRP